MLVHLTNCHGEWNFIVALVASIPFVSLWVKMKMRKKKK